MEAAILILFGFALGSTVASFLNVVADRVPAGGSITSPPSRCPVDGHRLKPYELVPVLSYLVQRGRCRVCASRIPLRIVVVEVIGGAVFAAIAYWYGATLDALLLAVTASFLLVIAIIDLEYKLVLNKVLLVAVPVAVVTSMLWSEAMRTPAWDFGGRQVSLLTDALVAGVAGAAFLFIPVLLTGGRGMGMGDVKLALAIGPWVGLLRLPIALMAAIVIAGLAGIILLALRISGRKDAIPFAPFLCIGTAVGLIWGESLGEWYWGLLTG